MDWTYIIAFIIATSGLVAVSVVSFIELTKEAKANKENLKKLSIENSKSLEYKYQIEKLIVELSKIAENINDNNLIK